MSTDYLFTRPTFRSGIASIANIAGTILYNSSSTDQEADHAALASDWTATGEDLREALNQYDR